MDFNDYIRKYYCAAGQILLNNMILVSNNSNAYVKQPKSNKFIILRTAGLRCNPNLILIEGRPYDNGIATNLTKMFGNDFYFYDAIKDALSSNRRISPNSKFFTKDNISQIQDLIHIIHYDFFDNQEIFSTRAVSYFNGLKEARERFLKIKNDINNYSKRIA